MRGGRDLTEEEVELLRADVFVVRILGRAALTGRVEHVQTGEKQVFHGLEELGHAIEHMQRRDGAQAAPPSE